MQNVDRDEKALKNPRPTLFSHGHSIHATLVLCAARRFCAESWSPSVQIWPILSSNCIGLQTAFRPNGGWWLNACGAPHRQQGPFIGQLYNCVCRKWLGLAASPSWQERHGKARHGHKGLGLLACSHVLKRDQGFCQEPSNKIFMRLLVSMPLQLSPLLHLSETMPFIRNQNWGASLAQPPSCALRWQVCKQAGRMRSVHSMCPLVGFALVSFGVCSARLAWLKSKLKKKHCMWNVTCCKASWKKSDCHLTQE